MNKLPSVFANPINKKINNVQDSFYSSRNSVVNKLSEREILRKIDQIFASKSHISKSRVIVTLKDGTKEIDLIGKTANNLLSLDGSLIRISDILDISKK